MGGQQTARNMNSEMSGALNVQLLTIYKRYDLLVRDTERGMH